MTTTELDARTDKFAKSDSTMFPLADKLDYYNEADGILNALIIDEQEDTGEEEDTKDTVALQNAYLQEARIHHVNWVKIDYGSGFVPARYKSEAELILEYGNEYENYLLSYDSGSPIYYYKGSHLFVYPAPTSAQAGADRLKFSQELIPVDLDRSTNQTPTLVPVNFHYLHAAYAAMSWLDEDDPLWAKAEKKWTNGIQAMIHTMFPRARQAEMVVGIPLDNGYDY